MKKKDNKRIVVVGLVSIVTVLLFFGTAQQGSLAIYFRCGSEQDSTVATKISTINNKRGGGTNRRKFISYTSSKWEQMWLDHVDEWAKNKSICQVLMKEQTFMMHDFLNLTCTGRSNLTSGWCVMDDGYKPLYYNTQNRKDFELTFVKPLAWAAKELHKNDDPVIPSSLDEHIVSKFEFLNEETGETYYEYIEPLVSHLRHPLSECTKAGAKDTFPLTVNRAYIIPPPPSSIQQLLGDDSMPLQQQETTKDASSSPNHLRGPATDDTFYYFDAGSSSWNTGLGGPSLSYFVEIWKRHGIDFDYIQAYEMTTPSDQFYKTIPKEYISRIHYQQCAVSSSAQNATAQNPFIPFEIKRATKQRENTFVFFKLDIDSPLIEDGSIAYLLENDSNVRIDELAWEHHVIGNYLMRRHWEPAVNGGLAMMSLRESYNYFLEMRQRGIRAHSWV